MAEIELKLRISLRSVKRALARVKRMPGAQPPVEKRLDTIYFDTADQRLRKAGLTLRVRSEDETRVQTVKREGGFERGEWEDRINASEPDLQKGKSGRAARDVIGKTATLIPQFRTLVTRTVVDIRKRDGTCVEVAFDRGAIIAFQAGHRAPRRLPIHEVEFELKDGRNSVFIFDIALALGKAVPLQIESHSKAERGFQLRSPQKPEAVRSPDVPLKKGCSLGAALKNAGRIYIHQFKQNIPAATQGEVEAVHQMRVALRRFRAALSLAKKTMPEGQYDLIDEKLKSLLQTLGSARNWDVLTERLRDVPGVAYRRNAAHRALMKEAAKRKEAAHARAVHAILSPANTVEILEVARRIELLDRPTALGAPDLDKPLRKLTGKMLDKQFSRVCKRSKGFARLDPDARHKLRIACKSLRYNAELLGQFFPRRQVRRFIALLKPVQNSLGELNDVRGAHQLLTAIGREKPKRTAMPAGEVLGWLDREAVGVEGAAEKTIERLRSAPGFW